MLAINPLPPTPARFGNRAARQTAIRQCRGAFAALGTALSVVVLLAAGQPVLAQTMHTLPFVTPASNTSQRSLVRIVNRSDRAGTVTIHGIDDSGERFGPVSFRLRANQTKHLDSRQLEGGATLSGGRGLGNGEGNWRLELETQLDILPLAYIRGAQGFITTMHDVVRGQAMRHHVLTFNKAPVSRGWSRGQLRLINPTDDSVDVTITGHDDYGNPGAGAVSVTLPAGASRTLTAHQLEGGDDDFDGSLGDGGIGRWQLFVSADTPIRVMNLMLSPNTGYMTNLSSMKGDDVIRGGPGGDELRGGNGDDIINPGDNGQVNNEPDIVHGSAGDDRIVYTDSGPRGAQSLRYSELNAGMTVMIEGAANRATVDKGSAGTDTIVDIANPLSADYGVFELRGTPFNDVFDLALDDGQWMDLVGNAGADTFNIESGAVRIDYETSPAGVDVDLDAGRTDDDGFGDSDTINGSVWGVAGSEFSDEIRGSDNNESFVGRAGNDRIDGRGGRDRVNFGPNNPRFAGFFDIGAIDLDLAAGTVTGTWNGKALSYTLRNIEWVQGGPGNDTLRGTDGNDILDGGAGNDVINPGDSDGNDLVYGSPGSDRIVYTDSTGDRAYQSLNYFWSYDAYYDHGLRVTVDGVGNRATVSKGPNGTDTIVDIANPMSKWGFGIVGTSSDDEFDLTVGNGQWMQFSGGPGDDTFDIHGDGGVRIDYAFPPPRNGIDVDLGAGRARDDGFGDVDTFSGRVGAIRGTDLTDTIRGSDNNETFIGRRGNDVIDGRGGWDLLRFDRTGVGNVVVDLSAGTATGTWGDSAFIHETPWFLEPIVEQAVGSAFSYTISNIEHVRGGNGDDRLYGSRSYDRLEGGRGNDILRGNGSPSSGPDDDDELNGGPGNDTFVIGRGDGVTPIEDFTNGEDRIDLNALGFASYSDVRAVTSLIENGNGIWIDLSRYGGGGIVLENFRDIDGLDASDFLL